MQRFNEAIGKLNYLEKASRPDIAYAVHQCAQFAESTKVEHTHAVKLIGSYLLGTRDRGMEYQPVVKSFEVFSNAKFSGNWDPSIAEFEQATARSRSGSVKYVC
jgi:hypothetical protein